MGPSLVGGQTSHSASGVHGATQASEAGSRRGLGDDLGWRAHAGLPQARRQDGWLRSPWRWITELRLRDSPGYQSHPSLPAQYVNFQCQDVLGQLSEARARGGVYERNSS